MRVNRSQLSDVLGYTVQTVDAYVRDGMPYLQRADRKNGIGWEFESAEVIKWILARARGDTAPPPTSSLKDAQTRELAARATLREIEVAEKQRTLIAVEDVVRNVQVIFSVVKSVLRAIPGRCAQPLSVMTDPKHVSQYLRDEVDAALESLADESTVVDFTSEGTE